MVHKLQKEKRKLTNDCQHGFSERGLEERGLSGDLASELTRGVQVHAPEVDLRLCWLALLEKRTRSEI